MSRLPSLSALYAFAVVSEHLSLSSAAKALFITQSAVSKQIKNLEAQLGIQLVHRTANRITLTEAGKQLSANLLEAFNHIEDGIRGVRQQDKDINLKVLAPPTLANRWLSVHLTDFHRQHPHISLTILTTPSSALPDVEIRFSLEKPSPEARLLAMEHNIIVCAPSIHHDNIENLIDKYPLLHIMNGEEVLPLWNDWFQQYSVTYRPSQQLHFSTQDQVITAALHELGLAIVDRRMVHDLLESGRLCQLEVKEQIGPYCYWILHGKGKRTEEAELFSEWLATRYLEHDAFKPDLLNTNNLAI